MEKVNKEYSCCPLGFFEEFIAVVLVKLSQIETENDKNPKFSGFQSFYAFFVGVSIDFVKWNILKGQQGTSWLSSSPN